MSNLLFAGIRESRWMHSHHVTAETDRRLCEHVHSDVYEARHQTRLEGMHLTCHEDQELLYTLPERSEYIYALIQYI